MGEFGRFGNLLDPGHMENHSTGSNKLLYVVCSHLLDLGLVCCDQPGYDFIGYLGDLATHHMGSANSPHGSLEIEKVINCIV